MPVLRAPNLALHADAGGVLVQPQLPPRWVFSISSIVPAGPALVSAKSLGRVITSSVLDGHELNTG